MIWENDELHKCFLYWQKRALEAEKEREELLDELEEWINSASYWKQQFLDKEKEAFECYTKKIIQEERRKGWIEVEGNR